MAVVILAALGCAESADPVPTTVQDSAGITILSYAGPVEPAQLVNVGALEVRIGTLQGEAGHDLHRVVGATVLGEELFVADAGSNQIRRFDRRGELLEAVGGTGNGPGEFSYLGWMGRYADSILAWDRATDRFSVYDRELTLQRTYSSAIPGGLARGQLVRGVFSDGSVFRSTDESFVQRTSATGIHRPPLATYLQGPGGEIVARPGLFLGPALSVHTSERTGRTIRVPVPFGDRVLFAVGRDQLVVADTELSDLRVFEGGEELSVIHRPSVIAGPVTDSALRAEIDRLLEPLPDDDLRERMRPEFESLPIATHLPWVTALVVDSEDRVWARLSTSEGIWAVFDPERGWLVKAVVPRGDVLEIGSDYILLLRRDELDVESVELHSLSEGNG